MIPSDFEPFSRALSDLADYYGKALTPAGIEIYWKALRSCEFVLVTRLMSEHVTTSRFMPSVAEILDRIRHADGRPGAEEAWAMLPKDEGQTVVWTDEMAAAFGVVGALIAEDRIAARMAFKETYGAEVAAARAQGLAVKWGMSLGHDVAGREPALLDAARRGRISVQSAAELLPYRDEPGPQALALIGETKILAAVRRPMPDQLRRREGESVKAWIERLKPAVAA